MPARSIDLSRPALTGTTPSCKSTLALTSIPFPSRASTGGFPQREPLRNGNEWLAKLMRAEDHDLRVTAMRIIETRRVFAETEFNWENGERVAREETAEDTLEMTKDFLARGLSASADHPVQARNENSW